MSDMRIVRRRRSGLRHGGDLGRITRDEGLGVDLSKTKPSKMIEDHTGYTGAQRGMDTVLTSLNPVYAYRNLRDTLIENGVISAPKRGFRLGFPKAGGR